MLLPFQGANPNVHSPRALPWAGCLLAFLAVTPRIVHRTPINKNLRSHSCKEHCANAGLFVYVNGGLFGLKFVFLRQRLPTFAICIISVGNDNE